jgi:inosine-uridine nucleoside N-ribohydrolase
MWDTMVAAWLLDPAVVTASDSAYLDAETAFGPRYGATIPLDRRLAPQATPVRAMRSLDFPRALALYTDLLTR